MAEIGRGTEIKEVPEQKAVIEGYKEIKPESDITIDEALSYLNHLFDPENLDEPDDIPESNESKKELTYEEKVKKKLVMLKVEKKILIETIPMKREIMGR